MRRAPLRSASATLAWTRGGAVKLNPAVGRAPELARSEHLEASFTWRPTRAMSLDGRGLWSSLSCFEGPHILRDEIVRLRWSYQITRALSARFIVQRQRLRSTEAPDRFGASGPHDRRRAAEFRAAARDGRLRRLGVAR
jgi:hypothetical protein